MVDEIVTRQELIDAKRDARDLGKAVNEDTVVKPRWGGAYDSLPRISRLWLERFDLLASNAESMVQDWQDAINLITVEGGIPALAVSDNSNQSQQEINNIGGRKWFNRDGGFSVNERIILENGDVVKSTTTNNTNNPNEDMMGWVGEAKRILSIKDYGAKYDGSNDQQYVSIATSKSKRFYIDDGETNIATFVNSSCHIEGIGQPKVLVTPDSNPVAVQLLANSITENIDFISTNNNKEWQRSEIKSNSIVRNVGFYNFGHISAQPNAWGIYLENVNNISLYNPKFGRNSQADIAIVDNVKNLEVFNASNAEDDGVSFNIEPNTTGEISGINCYGGRFRKVTLLENSATTYTIKNVNFIGAYIKKLSYRGAGVNFVNCNIGEIEGDLFGYRTINGIANAKSEHAGKLSIDNASLKNNLVADENLVSVSSLDLNSAWEVYQTEALQQYERVVSNPLDGKYTTLNINKAGYCYATSRNFIDISGLSVLAFVARCRVNTVSSGLNVNIALIRLFDSSDNLLYTHIVYANRAPAGQNIGFRNDVAIIKIPDGVTKAKISLRTNVNTSIDVARIGLFPLQLNSGNGNFDNIISSFASPVVLPSAYVFPSLPTGTHGLMFKQDEQFIVSSDGTYKVLTSGSATVPAVFSLKYKRKLYASYASVSYTLSANEIRSIVRTVAGAKIGDTVLVAMNQTLGTSSKSWAEVTASDTVTIYHQNLTAAAVVVLTTINIIVE